MASKRPWWNWRNVLISHGIGSYVAVGAWCAVPALLRGPDVSLFLVAATAPVTYPLLLLFTIRPFLERPSAIRICLVLLLYVAPFAAWSIRADRRCRRNLQANVCRACGYNLTGNVSDVCPECGSPILPVGGERT